MLVVAAVALGIGAVIWFAGLRERQLSGRDQQFTKGVYVVRNMQGKAVAQARDVADAENIVRRFDDNGVSTFWTLERRSQGYAQKVAFIPS
jgi:hypothetical protein